jgi:hypothetical protein
VIRFATTEEKIMSNKAYDPNQKAWRVPGPTEVVVNGVIVGADPDPNVRASIVREFTNGPDGSGADNAS